MLSATVFEHDDIGYFVDDSEPKLHRYNISNETWLSAIELEGGDGPPTVAHVDDDGIYVAFGQAVRRYNLDGSGRTHLLNTPATIKGIHSDGNVLFLNHSSGRDAKLISINKSTNAIIDTLDGYEPVYGSSISVQTNRIFGQDLSTSAPSTTYVEYNNAGEFLGGGEAPYRGFSSRAETTWVFPNGSKVVNNAGTIYSTDNMTYLNSFEGSIDDIAFYGNDVPIVLRDDTLTAFSQAMLPSGSYSLGESQSEIFVNDSNVIAFAEDTSSSTGFLATIVPLAELSPVEPGTPVNPTGLAYTPDHVEVMSDGTVMLYSKAHQSLFRWDPTTQSYIDTYTLRGTANYIAYSPETNRISLAYQSGMIRMMDFDASNPVELPFRTLPYPVVGLVAAGRYLVTRHVDQHYTFAPNGSRIDSDGSSYGFTVATWSEANQKVYYLRTWGSPYDLYSREIDENGTTYAGVPQGGLGVEIDSPHHSSHWMTGPIRVSPNGSVVLLGSGYFHDPQTLERQTLSLANSITDAAWLGDTLYTVRDVDGTSEFQRWTGATYDNDRSLEKPGPALALLAVSDTRLVGVSLDDSGVPVFSVLDENLGDHSIARDAVYVNDDFTQAEGTEIADADPNTPGDQLGIVGLNAFPTIQKAVDVVPRNGFTVYVTDDLSSDGPGFYAENLAIRKDVAIVGTERDSSAVVIDGGSSGRVVFVGSNQVTLNSLTLQNGSATTGAGIFNDGGNLLLENVVVQDNSVTVSGGGIYTAGAARTTLADTVVDGNTAARHGGGIWNSAASTLIVRSGSVVSDNQVSGDATTPGGGGIMNYGGRLALTDASVIHNVADGLRGSGGGIYSTGGEVTLESSTVSGNTASFAGGGIRFSGGRVQLSNSHLDSNKVGPESAGTGNGGGVHLSGSNSRFSHFGGTMNNNQAGWQGGGVWNQNGTVVIDRKTVIEGNRATGHASSHGGGIFHGGGRLSLSDGVTISQNEAGGKGGGIFIDDGSNSIRDSFVTDNTAMLDGGGIYMLTGNLLLDDVQVDRNTAGTDAVNDQGNGGGLHVHGREGQLALVVMLSGTVNGNSAVQDGGGIWNQGPTITILRGTTIDGNTASGDAALNGGGGIYNNSGRLAMLDVTISNNAADGVDGSGGGVFVVKGGVTIQGNSTVTGNTASRVGGGVEIIHGPFWFVDSTLSGNRAKSGGGLHVSGTDSGRIDIRNSLVTRNRAELEGGGLWNQSGNVMLVRSGSRVTGNAASGDASDQGGGGIFNNGGRLVLHDATIEGNSADGTAGSGGGLLLSSGTTTIQSSTLSNNTANRAGGGIEIANGRLLALDMSLIDNTAGPAGAAHPGNGGGLHVTGTTPVRAGIYGGTISGNTAARNGGGLWHQTGSVLAISQGTTIANNQAMSTAMDEGGGGLFNNGGRIAISEASLWGNSTDGSGGGLLSLAGTVTLDNTTVSGNTADGAGGGIDNHGNLISANTTIAQNRANATDGNSGTGGGLYNGGEMTLKNTIVAGNHIGSGSTRDDLSGNSVAGSSRYNLIGYALSAGGMTHGVNGNIIGNAGVDFLTFTSILEPLADNGGPTLSHLPVSGSLVIDNGLNSAAKSVSGVSLTRDQRGTTFSRINNDVIDIGAVEI